MPSGGEAAEAVVLDLNGCARCRGDGHPGIVFEPLRFPVEAGGVALTHWAPCPATGEPILMRVVPDAQP